MFEATHSGSGTEVRHSVRRGLRKLATIATPLVLLSVLSCTPEATAPHARANPGTAGFAISDAVHGGGRAGFYFLPPLVPQPATGVFDNTLAPVVEVCEWTTSCGTVIARFTTTTGTGGATVAALGDHYAVNWKTDVCASGPCSLDPAKTYRIRILVGGGEAGFADVDVVANGSQLKNVQTNEYIGLLNGRTLPVKFRIEVGFQPPPACVPQSSSLIHWWPGENGAQDIVGGDNGIVTGAVTYASGVVGQAFQFGNGYLRLSQNYGGTSTTELTVMAWVQTQQTGPSAWQAVLSSTSSSFVHFQSSTFGGAAVYTDPGSAQFNEIPSFGPTPLNVWRHVALTAQSGAIRIYENGTLISQLLNTFSYITQQDDAVLIGSGYGYGRPFPGLVDELQMYNRALTAAEVQQIFTAGSDGVCR